MNPTIAFTPPGGSEWIIILLVFILLFGAKKLPELGSSVGKSIKNFKKGIAEGKDEEGSVSDDAEVASQDEVTEQSTRKNTK